MRTSIIINQSVQTGIETIITSPIATSLYNQLKTDNVVDVSLIPCDLYSAPTDNGRLKKNIIRCNTAYDVFAEKYKKQGCTAKQAHELIKQIDIHANANSGKDFGCSAYYIGEKGKRVATPVWESLAAATPWSDKLGVTYNTTFYTLKKSVATNFLLEISFYDEKTQLRWMQENVYLIANAILTGFYNYLGYTGSSFAQSINCLAKNGIISIPGYWTANEEYDAAMCRTLVTRGVSFLTGEKYTFETAVHKAAELGLINSPKYWLSAVEDQSYFPVYLRRFIVNIVNALILKG